MNKWLKVWIFALLLPVLAKAQPTEQVKKGKPGLVKAISDLRKALLEKDSVTVTRLLADDVQYGHSNGLVETKSMFISAMMTGKIKYFSLVPSEEVIRMYGKTAIVRNNLKAAIFYEGKDLNLDMKVVQVWQRSANGWQLADRQSVKNQ
jgi:ketosteroid isomerase-like protein